MLNAATPLGIQSPQCFPVPRPGAGAAHQPATNSPDSQSPMPRCCGRFGSRHQALRLAPRNRSLRPIQRRRPSGAARPLRRWPTITALARQATAWGSSSENRASSYPRPSRPGIISTPPSPPVSNRRSTRMTPRTSPSSWQPRSTGSPTALPMKFSSSISPI